MSNMDWIDELFVFSANSPQSVRTQNGRFKTNNLMERPLIGDSEEEKEGGLMEPVNEFGEHLSMT